MKAEYPIISFPEEGTILYPYRNNPQVKPGNLEKAFAQELISKLPAEVVCHLDLCINTSDKLTPYCPDLALLVNGHPEIRIDVEIDEPYQAGTRKPIHYLSCGDMFRDHLLNRHGWTVVRLASKQIKQEPKVCADWLVELMNVMINKPHEANKHVFATVPFPVEMWTRNDALKMAYWQNVEGETKIADVNCYSLDEQEKKCQRLVKPFDKSDDMKEKMATFRDAGCYEQDAFIDFEPEEHIYIYKGIVRMLPVSSLIAYFYDEFQALPQAENQFRRYGTPVEDSLDKWRSRE